MKKLVISGLDLVCSDNVIAMALHRHLDASPFPGKFSP